MHTLSFFNCLLVSLFLFPSLSSFHDSSLYPEFSARVQSVSPGMTSSQSEPRRSHSLWGWFVPSHGTHYICSFLSVSWNLCLCLVSAVVSGLLSVLKLDVLVLCVSLSADYLGVMAWVWIRNLHRLHTYTDQIQKTNKHLKELYRCVLPELLWPNRITSSIARDLNEQATGCH